jgi:transcriptional regulator with XRE-family HTH domain
VQALRQEKGFTLRGLAELANKRMTRRHKTRTSAISYQVVYNTEAGRNAPRVDTLEAIALALDVSACFLAYGEEPTSEVAAGDPPKAA